MESDLGKLEGTSSIAQQIEAADILAVAAKYLTDRGE